MENNNQKFQFKTNINCGGCVETVKPHLDSANGIKNWDVDTTNKDKILTVNSVGITENEVMETVKTAGYKIESVK